MPRGGSIADRVEKIFNILELGRPLSLTTLAKRTNMHYQTAQQYIELIVDIQSRPRLEKIESERTVLVRLEKD
ncbi:MAG: hypothetical protein ACE5I5_16440 [Candidatus Heimdallarchaeota archaeon]